MDYNLENFYKSFPTMSNNRNRFPFMKEINFNMKMGEITPIAAIRVVPGQTYTLDLATVLKVAPLSVPPMDGAYYKAFAFYQADRNTWDNYKYWFGEKKYPENPENEPTYLVPKIKMPETGCIYNGFFDNIGIPPTAKNNKIDAYLARMDKQIYNTYFRNQSLENPLEVNTTDQDDVYDEEKDDKLRKLCRVRDFFAQCLPTQSGTSPVEIPLGSYAPVFPTTQKTIENRTMNLAPLQVGVINNDQSIQELSGVHPAVFANDTLQWGETGYNNKTYPVTTLNLVADLSRAMGAPLEGLYQAIAVNTLQYIKSRGGNRYFEQISNVYGCANPDGVLQLPEFLGATQQMIDFDTVTQTSSTENQETGLGYRGANGYLENYNRIINKSFGEFGWIIIYGVVTYHPKYQQGISKLMQTEDPLDLFNPIFNRIGDEAIYNSEIYAQDPSVVDEQGTPINDLVFGYGKRNSRLIYPISEIHGEQRSSYPQSLDANHFAENYKNLPKLNKDWDKVSDEGFKKSLAVQDETQFVGNALITGITDIEIPLDAIPSPIPDVLI